MTKRKNVNNKQRKNEIMEELNNKKNQKNKIINKLVDNVDDKIIHSLIIVI